jgi:hypothetical protein
MYVELPYGQASKQPSKQATKQASKILYSRANSGVELGT